MLGPVSVKPVDPAQDVGEQFAGNGDRGDLEPEVARVYVLSADLD